MNNFKWSYSKKQPKNRLSVYFDEIEDTGKQFIRFDKNLRGRSINPKLEIGKYFLSQIGTINFGRSNYLNFQLSDWLKS